MKIRFLIFMICLALVLIPYGIVYGENRVEYTIQINSDGSAAWIIKQTGINITASTDTFVEFTNRIMLLVEAAKNKTGREMTANEDTLSMTFTSIPDSSYDIVEYRFYWENFSKIENVSIVIGDVFQVQDFFLQLYGDGEVYMTYPSEYIVEELVSPTPSQRNDSLQILGWPGTEDFDNGGVSIILREKSVSSGFFEVLGPYAFPIVGLVVLASGFSIGFYMYRRRKQKETKIVEMPEFPSPFGVESDEEKTVKLLKSSGGSLYQSAITDRCGFSRAKTSQLLAVLEGKGIVRRYKKGRDKIVVLIEQDKK